MYNERVNNNSRSFLRSSWKIVKVAIFDAPIQIASAFLLRILPRFLLPLVALAFYAIFCFTSSPLIFLFLRYWLLPTTLIDETVYLDYSISPPMAKINLLSSHKQWSYLKDGAIEQSQITLGSRRFLTAGVTYTIDLNLKLSKSPRNYDLGKFMVCVKIFDESGEAIAEAYRPVAVPYQSPTSLLLENMALYPYRFMGFRSSVESTDVRVNVMNEFLEPLVPDPPSGSVEISLVANESADILKISMTMMPALYGIAYLLYHFPYTSFILGSCLVIALEILFSIFALLFYVVFSGSRGVGGLSSVEMTDEYGNDGITRYDSEKELYSSSNHGRRRRGSGSRGSQRDRPYPESRRSETSPAVGENGGKSRSSSVGGWLSQLSSEHPNHGTIPSRGLASNPRPEKYGPGVAAATAPSSSSAAAIRAEAYKDVYEVDSSSAAGDTDSGVVPEDEDEETESGQVLSSSADASSGQMSPWLDYPNTSIYPQSPFIPEATKTTRDYNHYSSERQPPAAHSSSAATTINDTVHQHCPSQRDKVEEDDDKEEEDVRDGLDGDDETEGSVWVDSPDTGTPASQNSAGFEASVIGEGMDPVGLMDEGKTFLLRWRRREREFFTAR